MSNKTHPIALVFVGLLFSVAAAEVSADASAELEQAKSNIISLVNGGNYAHAQTQIQKVVDDYPQYEHAWHAQFTIGRCYDVLKDTAYKQLLEKYPDCPAAEQVRRLSSNKIRVQKEEEK